MQESHQWTDSPQNYNLEENLENIASSNDFFCILTWSFNDYYFAKIEGDQDYLTLQLLEKKNLIFFSLVKSN